MESAPTTAAPIAGCHGPSATSVHYRKITDRLAELAGHRNAVDAEIVRVLEEVVATDAWAVDGIRTVTQWVTWQLGVPTGEAKRLVELAKARAAHPAVAELFDRGQLSLAQASIASRVAAHRDQEIADVATVLTIPQLQLFVRAMRNSDSVGDPDAPTDPAPVPAREEFVRFGWDDSGWLTGRFELDAEHGHLVEAALAHARDLLFHHEPDAQDDDGEGTDDGGAAASAPSCDDTAEDATTDADTARDEAEAAEPAPAPAAAAAVPVPAPVGSRRIGWVDALVALANRSRDADPSPSRRDRFRINVHLHPDQDQRAVWADWGAVPRWLADKLLCDGTISPVFTDGAVPVSVGRSQRVVTNRLRRLILHRDRGQCRVPWCTNRRWLDIHHLVPWAAGGPTDSHNLAAICPTCHDAIHRGVFHVTGNADDPFGLIFTDRYRRTIETATAPIPPNGAAPPTPPQPYEHPYGEQLRRDDVWVDPPPWRRPHRDQPAA